MSSDAKFFGVVAVVAVLVLGGIIFFSKNNKSTTKEVVRSELEAGQAVGPQEAKVTLVEFSDFQCPACRANFPAIKQVIERNPDIRFVYRHFPLPSHPFSKLAAQASEAAGKQGKFWQMHDKLFETQESWSASNSPEKTFEGFAADLGLNVEQFKKDLTSNEIESIVERDFDYGNSIQVSKTPTFFLNGVEVESGASPDEWQKRIDELKK